MKITYDLHVEGFTPLIPPAEMKKQLTVSSESFDAVVRGRQTVTDILKGRDKRLLVITGPCSIHDTNAAMEYATRLKELQAHVADSIYLVMRVYFEKPRTTVGWKGLINDPCLDGTCDVETGIRRARKLLLDITAMGMPTATEILDPITPQYLAGLICWTAIGARTTESQTHRELASGLSMPVGFKNGTEGDLATAINAIIAAGSPQNFLGIDPQGRASIVETTGNPTTHLVLRGGRRPNYDSVSIQDALEALHAKGLSPGLVVDCSHANSRKNYSAQTTVWQDVINQRLNGNGSVVGLMLESNLFAGNQKNTGSLDTMQYGVSITDACIDWETTQGLILSAHDGIVKSSGK